MNSLDHLPKVKDVVKDFNMLPLKTRLEFLGDAIKSEDVKIKPPVKFKPIGEYNGR